MVFSLENGMPGTGLDVLAAAPANAGFFALGLAILQGISDLTRADRLHDPLPAAAQQLDHQLRHSLQWRDHLLLPPVNTTATGTFRSALTASLLSAKDTSNVFLPGNIRTFIVCFCVAGVTRPSTAKCVTNATFFGTAGFWSARDCTR